MTCVILLPGGAVAMSFEYREWNGVRMTFLYGKKEPVWLAAELARKLGFIPRAARRLRWERQHVRMALYHAEWNAPEMERERAAAMAAGFRSDILQNSPHGLVFPGSALAGKPIQKKRWCPNSETGH